MGSDEYNTSDNTIATFNFRWFVKKNGERVLQQGFFKQADAIDIILGNIDYLWIDIPIVHEEKANDTNLCPNQ